MKCLKKIQILPQKFVINHIRFNKTENPNPVEQNSKDVKYELDLNLKNEKMKRIPTKSFEKNVKKLYDEAYEKIRTKFQNNNYLVEIEQNSANAVKIIKQYLDQITGYESIDKLKNEISEIGNLNLFKLLEKNFIDARELLKLKKKQYQDSVEKRAQVQKEINDLLQRKNNWSEKDVSKFTDLYRLEHENEIIEKESKKHQVDHELLVDKSYTELVDKIRNRYHEEQLWSDKIRATSSYWTLALIGLNFIFYGIIHLYIDPKRREKMVISVSNEIENKLDKKYNDFINQLVEIKNLHEINYNDLKNNLSSTPSQTLDASKIFSDILRVDSAKLIEPISYLNDYKEIIIPVACAFLSSILTTTILFLNK